MRKLRGFSEALEVEDHPHEKNPCVPSFKSCRRCMVPLPWLTLMFHNQRWLTLRMSQQPKRLDVATRIWFTMTVLMAKSRSMTLAPCCESRYTALFCAKLDPHVWAFRPQRKLPTRRLARELRKSLQRQKQAWKCIRTMNQSLSLPDSTVIVIPIMIIIDHPFTNQSIKPPMNESMNESMNQSINQASKQSINQSINVWSYFNILHQCVSTILCNFTFTCNDIAQS